MIALDIFNGILQNSLATSIIKVPDHDLALIYLELRLLLTAFGPEDEAEAVVAAKKKKDDEEDEKRKQADATSAASEAATAAPKRQ